MVFFTPFRGFASDELAPTQMTAPRSLTEQVDSIVAKLGTENDFPAVVASPSATQQIPRLPNGQVQLATTGMAIQLGRVGILALQALGAAGAAILASIIKSFQNRLGRPPTPQELDAALSEQAEQRREPTVPPPPAADASRQPKKDYGEECEPMRKKDSDECWRVTQKHGRQAGRICYNSAMMRWAECLHRGPDSVRTPLSTYFEE